MAQYENKGDRLNILLADELPEDMTGTQDTQNICGKCAWYSFAKLESICRKTGKEVAYFANKECFTTDKDMDMEENNNAQPVAETGTQVCKECGRTLPLEDFQRRRNGNVDNVCKACRAEKARIGIARKKAVKVENQLLDVTSEEAANAKRVEIAQLSRYLTDFKMAGLALWGNMPGKEEDIDDVIKAEWAVPFCRDIFAAAADLKRDGKNVIPTLVARRCFDSFGQKFVADLGETFYLFAKECDTEEQKPAEWSEEDEEMLNSCISSIEESKENRYAYRENDGDTSYDREIAWLKSLRSYPKSSDNWKPSEEQPAQEPVVILKTADFSDANLLDELRRRGYKGTITKVREVEL